MSKMAADASGHLIHYLGLDTIHLTRDASALAKNHDENDEVVLFDASALWSGVSVTRHRALLSPLPPSQPDNNNNRHHLPRRSSPLPSMLQGDELIDPNLSRIGPLRPKDFGHAKVGGPQPPKPNKWTLWQCGLVQCLAQCAPMTFDNSTLSSAADETDDDSWSFSMADPSTTTAASRSGTCNSVATSPPTSSSTSSTATSSTSKSASTASANEAAKPAIIISQD